MAARFAVEFQRYAIYGGKKNKKTYVRSPAPLLHPRASKAVRRIYETEQEEMITAPGPPSIPGPFTGLPAYPPPESSDSAATARGCARLKQLNLS